MARRRRRTAQEQRKKRRNTGSRRKWLTVLALVALFLLLSPFVIRYQLLNWLQGSAFREQLSETITNKAQAQEVSIPENLRIDDERVSLPAVTLRRNDIVQMATGSRIVADIEKNKLYDRELYIRKLTMEEGLLRLDTAAIGAALPPIKEDEDGLLARLAPQKVQLKAFECTDADVELTMAEKLYSLAGCRITAEPVGKSRKNEWHITLENGRVHTPLSYLRSSSVKVATILCDRDSISLTECRLVLTPGELRAKGAYSLQNNQWHLNLRANKANVERLLNEDWKKRLSGELYGTLKINGKGSEIKEATGSISLQQGVLEGLPILSQLTLVNSTPYRTINLEKAECRVRYPYSQPRHNIKAAWCFDNIDIRATEGSLLIKGHVIICPDGALHGTLTVGLPDNVVDVLAQQAPTVVEQIFNAQGAPGYRWFNINLSGTTEAPREDLSARLKTILATAAPQAALDMAGSAARSAGEIFGGLLAPGTTPANGDEEQPDSPPSGRAPSPTDILDIIF